jgi:hypothetical protein
VKGVLVEVKGEAGDNVLLDDNGVNLVPGGGSAIGGERT